MKSKGINSIKLRYKGALTGGTDQSSIMTASLLARLGTRSDLKDLVEYVNAQNMEMYLDVNLLSAARGIRSLRVRPPVASSAKRQSTMQ